MRRSHALLTGLLTVLALLAGTTTLVTIASPAAAAASFVGNIELVTSPAPGQFRVAGWMFDDDAPSTSIGYHVYVGGTGPGDPTSYGFDMGLAAERRDDVGAAYAGAGPYHGFDAVRDVPIHGNQMVYVFALNAGGTPGENALLWSGVISIANPPPDTTITSRPPATSTSTAATVAFAASEPSTFTCRWDQGAWQPCTSPVTATVAVGSHTFSVYATDTEGAADPSPASYAFTVTAPPPPPPPPVVAPVPPPPPPPTPTITLDLRAVKKKSRLRIDIGPDLDPSNYRFTIQRRGGSGWRTIRRTQTLGARDVSIINLARGRYRVVVPRQHDLVGARAEVRLRR